MAIKNNTPDHTCDGEEDDGECKFVLVSLRRAVCVEGFDVDSWGVFEVEDLEIEVEVGGVSFFEGVGWRGGRHFW